MKRKAYYTQEDLDNLTKTYHLTNVREWTDTEAYKITSKDFADDSDFDASNFKGDDLDEILKYLALQWCIYVGKEASDNACFHFDFASDGEMMSFDSAMQADFISKVLKYIKDNYMMGYDFSGSWLTFDTRDITIWKEIIKNSFSSIEVTVSFTTPYWDDDNIDDEDVSNGEDFFYESIEGYQDNADAYINVTLSFQYKD